MKTTFYFIAKKYLVSFHYFVQKKFLAAVFILLAIPALAGTPDCEHCGQAKVKNVLYAVNGKMVALLAGNVFPGDEVTVSFTLPEGSDSTVFSLVSYKASGSMPAEGLNTVYDMSSKVCGPGTHLLTVRVPETYYSLAFVRGCVNFEIGPARCRDHYTQQGRLIDEISADVAGELMTRSTK